MAGVPIGTAGAVTWSKIRSRFQEVQGNVDLFVYKMISYYCNKDGPFHMKTYFIRDFFLISTVIRHVNNLNTLGLETAD